MNPQDVRVGEVRSSRVERGRSKRRTQTPQVPPAFASGRGEQSRGEVTGDKEEGAPHARHQADAPRRLQGRPPKGAMRQGSILCRAHFCSGGAPQPAARHGARLGGTPASSRLAAVGPWRALGPNPPPRTVAPGAPSTSHQAHPKCHQAPSLSAIHLVTWALNRVLGSGAGSYRTAATSRWMKSRKEMEDGTALHLLKK